MRIKILIAILFCCILLITTQIASVNQQKPEEAWKNFKAKYESPGLQIVWNKQGDVPSVINGISLAPQTAREEPVQKDVLYIALSFINENRNLIQIPSQDVKMKNVWKFQNKWYVTLQTFYQGIPIYQGQVGFTLDEKGRILAYASNYNPKMELSIEPKISKEQAEKLAHRYHKPRLKLPAMHKEAYLIIYQEPGENEFMKYRLSWYVFLATKAGHPGVDRIFIIDAQTGQLIKDFYPHPETITGTIQGEVYPVHSTDAVVTRAFEHEEVSVPGTSANTDAAGSYSLNPNLGSFTLTTRLEGPFVKVQSYNSATGADQDIVHNANVTNPGTHNFNWTSANCAPDDGDGLNVFWHANHLHDDYYQAVLGINWTNPATGGSQMTYSVNRGTINNAYSGNPVLIYSDATARNCDVTYHETTHNVLNHMFGGSYIGWPNAYSEGYAFDEGFADYVACSFNNDSLYAENVHATRNCNNNDQYPGATYNIEGHTGGQLISGVAWDLWNKQGLSHNVADVLLFAGLSQMATLPSAYYFSNPNHSNYLTSLLTADDDNNNVVDGTPNDREIFQAFRNHDLLPVDIFCKDSPQDDGNVPSGGYCWTSPDIWIRNNQDGGATHQDPIYNQANYVYVKVRNLGYLTANTTKIKAYWADPATGIPWPSDWNYIGEVSVNNLAKDSETVAPPIAWTPTGTAIGHRCLLVRLECAQDMMTEEGTVKNENNIAQKNISIVPMPSAPSEPAEVKFFVKNYPDQQIDLLFFVKKLRTEKELAGKEAVGELLPIRAELEMPKLTAYGKLSGFSYEKGKGFWPFNRVRPRFKIDNIRGEITSLKFKPDRLLCKIRLFSTEEFRPGEVFEVTIQQNVDREPVGGLTYVIRKARD